MVLPASLAALLLALSGVESLVLIQDKSLSVSPQGNVKMSCSGKGRYTMSWYQQKSGSLPNYLLAGSSRASGLPSRFTQSDSGDTNYLHINGVTAEDEAVYYCACVGCGSDHHARSPSPPTLTLLPPSPTELSEGRATLVCLAQGFHPDSVTVSWTMDGHAVADGGVQTSESQRQSDRTYSTSSLLTLTATQWSSGRPVSCQLSHSALTSPLSRTLSQPECSS